MNNDGGPGYVDQGEDPLLREGEVLSIHAGVNFINVLRKHFSYERHFGSFFSSYMYVVKAAKTMFVRKICTFNIDEIDYRRQFHQHFLWAFFIQIFRQS